MLLERRGARAEAGAAILIPGGAVHSCRNAGASDLRFAYFFATDSFEDVEDVFEPTA